MGPEHNPAGGAFGPAHRLHSNRDYGRVFHRQQKAAGRHTGLVVSWGISLWVLVVLLMPRARKAAQQARLGIMVGAKAVKTAVRRHQLKRWVRELFRTRLKSSLAGHDCVVLFRSNPPEEAHTQLDEEISGLVAKALTAQAQPGQRGGRRR